MFSVGQIVFSKSGRDMGNSFVIVDIQNEYLFLSDGRSRLLSKPKKKKYKHVQPTNVIVIEIKNKLEKNQYLLDAEIRKALMPYPGLGKC